MLLFQSALPARGGTTLPRLVLHSSLFQSTLPVWGGAAPDNQHRKGGRFQSTLPARGGTAKVHKNSFLFHALLTNSLAFFVTTSCFLGENQKNRRRICQNLSAKVSGKSWALPLRTGLDHQGPAGIVAGFHPIVGDLFRIVVSQIIDPQAVLFPVHNGHKFCLQSPQNTTLHRSRHTYSPEMNHSQASTEICPVPTLAISSMWQNFFESPLLYSANFANHSFRTLLR